jgi:predicted enzyme related to lactoylglutathione lyase
MPSWRLRPAAIEDSQCPCISHEGSGDLTDVGRYLADMAVTRIVPDITSNDIPGSKEFYRLLGLEERMDLGWTVILGPSERPDVQLLLMERDQSAPVNPDISIGVDDVDAAHEQMVAAGAEIVHSLQDEPWGVRRFFVRDPNGKIVNIVQNL